MTDNFFCIFFLFCRETQEKFDIKIENDTITYRERKSYTFVPEKSSGSETDMLFAPNLPALVRISFVALLLDGETTSWINQKVIVKYECCFVFVFVHESHEHLHIPLHTSTSYSN